MLLSLFVFDLRLTCAVSERLFCLAKTRGFQPESGHIVFVLVPAVTMLARAVQEFVDKSSKIAAEDDSKSGIESVAAVEPCALSAQIAVSAMEQHLLVLESGAGDL